MARATSVEAYHKIRDNGMLSHRRFEVYEVLHLHGPLTAGEVWKFHLSGQGVQIDSIRPRMAELESRGVVRAVDRKVCRHSGQTCLTWETTDGLPQEPTDRPETSKQKIQRLEARIAELEAELKEHRRH